MAPESPLSHTVHVNVAAQSITLRNSEGRAILTVPCSTGAAGTGCTPDSGQTPTGRFAVCSAHGENAPLSTIFKGRIPVGTWEPGCREKDAILARILCLEGLEPHNANTRSRYIYIHGTADTASLGSPVSHGCIRMDPTDIAHFFPLCPVGTKVFIEA
ncbi:MAG: L,D-transpeptidase [Akkermansia sp.]|nr:L,D-transpeptidase [Akkermansia sp.]